MSQNSFPRNSQAGCSKTLLKTIDSVESLTVGPNEGLMIQPPSKKCVLMISLEDFLVFPKKNSNQNKNDPSRSSWVNASSSDECDYEPREDLFYFFLAVSPLYRICLVSRLSTKKTKEILIKNNIYQFVEGHLCPGLSTDRPLHAEYVAISSTLKEQDYENAVYINIPKELFFLSSQDRRLMLPATADSVFKEGLLKNMLAFLTHLYSKGFTTSTSIDSFYQQFNEKYGGGLIKEKSTFNTRTHNNEEENLSLNDADDDIRLEVKSLISPVESLKTRILYCSASDQYEEICDFTKINGKNFTSTNSSCFDRIMYTPSVNFSPLRDLNGIGIRRGVFSEESEAQPVQNN